MSNYSIFDQNVCHAFRGASDDPEVLEEMEYVYFKGRGRSRVKAEQAALDLGRVLDLCLPLMRRHSERFSFSPDPREILRLKRFVSDRLYHRDMR